MTVHDDLRSIDLHVEHPAGEIVHTKRLRDVGCGMYPAYYVAEDDRLAVSTSVVALVAYLGDLEPNPEFAPPEYLSSGTSDRLVGAIKRPVARLLPQPLVAALKSELQGTGAVAPERWYPTWETIDRRITKLRPFECRGRNRSVQSFAPTMQLWDRDELVCATAANLTSFINGVERAYPEREHVILMGGRDSQLVGLVPKLTENWHVFSSEPNYPLVEQFVEKNDLSVESLRRADDVNRESDAALARKLVASDLYSDPRHLRWLPQLERLADDLGDCIFWQGTEGDTFYTHHAEYHDGSKQDFFDMHLTRAPSWQGNYHQVVKNYTGQPVLSPYHSEQIWRAVYERYDPACIGPTTDLRSQIGAALRDDEIWWPDENPTPSPYTYENEVRSLAVYLAEIERALASGGEMCVGVERTRHSG